MISNLSRTLSEKLSSSTNSSSEEKEIYAYSLEVLLSLIVNLIILFVTAYIFNAIPKLVMFLIFFSGLRSFAGGYHAKSHMECMVLSFITFSISAVSTLFVSFGEVIMIMGIISSILLVFTYAPAESKNKPLNSAERKRFMAISRGIVILFSMEIVILYYYKAETNYIYLTAVTAMLIESLSLLKN